MTIKLNFIPGKLYQLKKHLGFDEVDGENSVWLHHNDILLFLGHIKIGGYTGPVLCFLFNNKKLWRPEDYYNSIHYMEVEC